MARRLVGALATAVAGSSLFTPRTRVRILRTLGVEIGAGTRIFPGVRFLGRVDLLRFGRDCFVNAELLIGSNAPIVIGDRVSIGPRVQLIPTTHELGPSRARAGRTKSEPIEIGAGSWIGGGVIVLGGVRIGAGCVIAAGAVVTTDCESDSLYAGVPARLVRALDVKPATGEHDGTAA